MAANWQRPLTDIPKSDYKGRVEVIAEENTKKMPVYKKPDTSSGAIPGTDNGTVLLISTQQDSEPGSSWMKAWSFSTWSSKVDDGVKKRQHGKTNLNAVPRKTSRR
jgi:hypothetical protein